MPGREAEALGKVSHPGIVRIHLTGRTPQGPYLVQELLDGTPLDAEVARALPSEAVRGLGAQVLHGVVAATLADAGDFKGAQREIARAIDICAKSRPDDPRLVAWRAQQASYARGQAWREP